MEMLDKHGNVINDGKEFAYKAVASKPPIKAVTYTINGIRFIKWEDEVIHQVDDYWDNDFDSELSELYD